MLEGWVDSSHASHARSWRTYHDVVIYSKLANSLTVQKVAVITRYGVTWERVNWGIN